MKECYFCGKKTDRYAMVKVAEDIKTIIEVPTCPKCVRDLDAELSLGDFINDKD